MTEPQEYPMERPSLPRRATVYEVGPRDGLQNEAETLPVDVRVRFVDLLTEAGLPAIEVGSFVSPTAVPQLADTDEVFRRIQRASGVRYPALVPNVRKVAIGGESGDEMDEAVASFREFLGRPNSA